MTKVKELLNPRINGHNEHILSVPWRDLSMFLTVYRFRTDRLGVSVQKKLSSVRTAWDIRLKKLLSVRTAWAIRSEKNLSTVRATEAICSKVNFSRVSIPKPFRR